MSRAARFSRGLWCLPQPFSKCLAQPILLQLESTGNLHSSEQMAASGGTQLGVRPFTLLASHWRKLYKAGLLLASLRVKGWESRKGHTIMENTGPLGMCNQCPHKLVFLLV